VAQVPPPGHLWIGPSEIAALPTSGAAWDYLRSKANSSCPTPNLSNQDDTANVCVLAKALVFARTGDATMRLRVVDALRSIVNAPTYSGLALALGRELPAYVIAADLINLRGYDPALDGRFRQTIAGLLVTYTSSGPSSLIECHELRPNNWGTHCGAARAAVAAYLGDAAHLARVAQVFKGWLGDRGSYAGFKYGDLSWQCDPARPVGVNPQGCRINGVSVDGVLPDDQRRGGSFSWPPPGENYVYEGLQGALVQAAILTRAGYDAFGWENQALRRAFRWLHDEAHFPATGDDTWEPYLVNYHYASGAAFPTQMPARPGKNVGYTDWTHATAPGPVSSAGGSYVAAADAYVRGSIYASQNFGRLPVLESKDGNGSSQMYDRRTFVRFDLSAAGGGPVAGATLKLYVTALPNGAPVRMCVNAVSSDAWSETGITWSNQPAAGSTLDCEDIGSTGWVAFDVTNFVAREVVSDRIVTLRISDTASSNRMVRFESREGANAPSLVVR
jgi:hypothetical protein